MKRTLGIVVALGAIVALVVTVTASGKQPSPSPSKHGGNHGQHGKAITVIEHATSDTTTDTGATGDSVGDGPATFANDLFDAGQMRRRSAPTRATACASSPAPRMSARGPGFLPGGQIVVSGPFYDAKDSTLAITGGTGLLPQRPRNDGSPLARGRHGVRLRLPRRGLSQAMRPPLNESICLVHPPANGTAGSTPISEP